MTPKNEIKIAKGIEVLKLPGYNVYPTLIWDDETVVLVDTGFPGQFDLIRYAMEEVDVPFRNLNKVIITHQDYDHIGGLPEILKTSDRKIEVIAHTEEKPFIEGKKPLLKMPQEIFEALPAEKREEAKANFLESLKSKVYKTVDDGEVLPYCGGITVIFTPGHTPGHICLYMTKYKTLIAGDALNIEDGQLVGPNTLFTPDLQTAKKSLEKFGKHDIETVICYHGGVFRENVNVRLQKLAEE